MKCIFCGEEIHDDARFCGFCGAEQVEAPVDATPAIEENVIPEVEAVPEAMPLELPVDVEDEPITEIPELELTPAIEPENQELDEPVSVPMPELESVVESEPVEETAPIAEPVPVVVPQPEPQPEPIPEPVSAPVAVTPAPQPEPVPAPAVIPPVVPAPQPVYQAPPQPQYQAPQPVYQAPPQPQYQPQPVYQAPPQPQYQPAPQPQYQPRPQYQPAPQYQSRPVQQPMAQRPVPQRPAYQLPTGRGLIKLWLLTFITCGIYPMVMWSRMSVEINMVASRYDGKRTMHFLWMPVIGALTLGIYMLVWLHNLCSRIGNELKRRQVNYKFSAASFWLWNFVYGMVAGAVAGVVTYVLYTMNLDPMILYGVGAVLGIAAAVGPAVFGHKILKAFNLMNADYNEKG